MTTGKNSPIWSPNNKTFLHKIPQMMENTDQQIVHSMKFNDIYKWHSTKISTPDTGDTAGNLKKVTQGSQKVKNK